MKLKLVQMTQSDVKLFLKTAGAKVLLLALLCLFVPACSGGTEAVPVDTVNSTTVATEDDPFADDDAMDSLTKIADSDDFEDDDYFDDDYTVTALIPDPIEPWNRFWHGFNDKVINYAVRPIAKGYEFIVPTPVRGGISNVFKNIKAPGRMLNCLLQGKGLEAGVEFSSFILNSTAGIGGIFDVAASHKTIVPATGEDFGQTLGKWGVGEGFYIVWPFLGPSNLRETLGTIGDYGISYATNPLTYVDSLSWWEKTGISSIRTVNSFGDLVRAYDTFQNMAIDPYSSMRDGYTKLRRSAIAK